jgi:hypothetical protein
VWSRKWAWLENFRGGRIFAPQHLEPPLHLSWVWACYLCTMLGLRVWYPPSPYSYAGRTLFTEYFLLCSTPPLGNIIVRNSEDLQCGHSVYTCAMCFTEPSGVYTYLKWHQHYYSGLANNLKLWDQSPHKIQKSVWLELVYFILYMYSPMQWTVEWSKKSWRKGSKTTASCCQVHDKSC